MLTPTPRRTFLKQTALLGTGVLLNPHALAAKPGVKKSPATHASGAAAPSAIPHSALRAFIVSDAHFGWVNPDQPTPDTQLRLMRTITAAFPDLDLFIDTGDAHHGGNTPDSARADWTDIIQGACGTPPFYYVMGNHDQKIEARTNIFASNENRPYYSFDLHGIHFISLPEQMDHSYIPDTARAWLKLDLQLHHDKTTIAFSHNSLKGTTNFFNDRAYRQLTNSDAMHELFRAHPNIIAWMHGHNHTWEVVPKNNTLYVSNGRIGGFDPRVYAGTNHGAALGAGHLGGIYFEITPDALHVRSFSATRNKFFDELTLPSGGNYTHKLARPTTLDLSAPPAYNHGYGGSPSGQTLRTHHHHLGGARTLYLTGAQNPTINENPGLAVFAQRTSRNFMQKILSGYALLPNEEDKMHIDPAWDWLPPAGVRLHKRATPAEEKGIFAPNHNYSHFLCSPGESYTLTLVTRTQTAGRIATPVCRIHGGDNADLLHEQKAAPRTLKGGEEELSWTFDIPPLAGAKSKKGGGKPAYETPDMKLSLGVMFTNLTEDLDILSFRFRLADASPAAQTLDPVITIDDKQITHTGPLPEGDLRNFPLPETTAPQSTLRIAAKGNARVTWL